MNISEAGADDIPGLARLLFTMANPEERAEATEESFAGDLATWWAAHEHSHSAFVARLEAPELVGMAWVALVPRVPRPGSAGRLSADIQSVLVLPEHRGRGVGSALITAATEHATRLGATRVQVHAGSKAVPLYERLGFASSGQLLQIPPD